MRSTVTDRLAALEMRAARAPSLDLADARERLRALRLAHAQGLPLPAMAPQERTAEGDMARERLRRMLTRHARAQEGRHGTA